MCRVREWGKKKKMATWLYYFNGLLCLVWLLARSGARPERLRYPCQQYALGQVVEIPLFMGIFNFLKPQKGLGVKKEMVVFGVIISSMLGSMLVTARKTNEIQTVRTRAVGATGLCRNYPAVNNGASKVVEIRNEEAVNFSYDGRNYFDFIDQNQVDLMVEAGIKEMTNKQTVSEALEAIFPNYSQNKTIAVKVNGNDFVHGLPISYLNTEPQVVRGLIKLLVKNGTRQENIWVVEGTGEDTADSFPAYFTNIVMGNDLKEIRFYRKGGPAGYDCSGGRVVFNYKVPYLPRCQFSCITSTLTQADYLVDIPIVKAIRTKWGISGAIKSMQGVTNNQYCHHDPQWDQSRFEPLDIDDESNPMATIYSNPNIRGKIRLIINSGLLGNWTGFHFEGEGNGGNGPKPFVTRGNKALSTLLFSNNPVAVDSVAANIIIRERVTRDLACVEVPMIYAASKAGLGTFEVFDDGKGEYRLIDHRLMDISQTMGECSASSSDEVCGCIPCPNKNILRRRGDANCNGVVDAEDYSFWRRGAIDGIHANWADFGGSGGRCDGRADLIDYSIWKQAYLGHK